MKVSIDRIDEGIAVLVVKGDPPRQIRLPAALLPPGSREGDVLTLRLEADAAGTAAVKERVSGLIEKLRTKW